MLLLQKEPLFFSFVTMPCLLIQCFSLDDQKQTMVLDLLWPTYLEADLIADHHGVLILVNLVITFFHNVLNFIWCNQIILLLLYSLNTNGHWSLLKHQAEANTIPTLQHMLRLTCDFKICLPIPYIQAPGMCECTLTLLKVGEWLDLG